MSSPTNDLDRATTASAPTDDLEPKVFAHWNAAVHHDLGDTVPMDLVE